MPYRLLEKYHGMLLSVGYELIGTQTTMASGWQHISLYSNGLGKAELILNSSGITIVITDSLFLSTEETHDNV